MKRKIKIITVDDHDIFRKGLNMLINKIDNIEVVGEASNGIEFLDLLDYHKPDMVFIDIRMPKMNGIEATRKALEKYPDLKIAAISMFGEEEYLENMIKAGAKGFLLKNIDAKEIEFVISQILSGRNYYSTELLPYFTEKYITLSKKSSSNSSLTKRELDILNLIAKGYTNKQIAEKLYISKRTVDGHRANIFEKTDSKNVVTLLIYAIKKGIVKI